MELFKCFFYLDYPALLWLRVWCEPLLEWIDVLFFSSFFYAFEGLPLFLSDCFCPAVSFSFEDEGLPLLREEGFSTETYLFSELGGLPRFFSEDFGLSPLLSFYLLKSVKSIVIFLGLDCSKNLFPSSIVANIVPDLCSLLSFSSCSVDLSSRSIKLWPFLMLPFTSLEPLIFFLLLSVWLEASIFSDFRFRADFFPLFLGEASFCFEVDRFCFEAESCSLLLFRSDSWILTDFLAERLLFDFEKQPSGQLFFKFSS